MEANGDNNIIAINAINADAINADAINIMFL
jgi:hypothetical protein